jgi:hypothetical protein
MCGFVDIAIVGLLVITGFFTGILNMVAAGGSALVILCSSLWDYLLCWPIPPTTSLPLSASPQGLGSFIVFASCHGKTG